MQIEGQFLDTYKELKHVAPQTISDIVNVLDTYKELKHSVYSFLKHKKVF